MRHIQLHAFTNLRHFSVSILSLVFLPISLLHADVLASWDNWSSVSTSVVDADSTASGFSANVDNIASANTNTSFGSNDGTFGDSASGAVTSGGSLLVNAYNNRGTLNITFTNNSGQDYSIDSLHFDFAPRENGNQLSHGFNAFILSYVSGGLGPDSTEIDSQSGLSNIVYDTTDAISNYPGYDYTLASSLSDTTLADGESAIFSIVFSGETPTNIDWEGQYTSSIFDNLAIQGAVIPEPSSLLLLLVSGLGFVCLRRKR